MASCLAVGAGGDSGSRLAASGQPGSLQALRGLQPYPVSELGMPTPPRVLPTHHLQSSSLGACTAPGACSREYEAVIFLPEPLLWESSGPP